MTTTTAATSPAASSAKPIVLGSAKGSWFSQVGWRYLVAVLALAFAIFPALFIVSAALNPAGSLQSTNLIPSGATLKNFKALFDTTGLDFTQWYVNSLLISIVTAVAQVFIGACAAFAFSRYRFRGRRTFMLALLLLQMFPSLLALVAMYLIFIKIGGIFPAIGLNTPWALILAYCGGVLGGNVWLLKGYFDTVPKELDESARVDGASHAQVFFGIILPLVRPILATVGLLTFVAIYSEFLLASVFLTSTSKQTLAVGLYGLIAAQRNANFGVFCAGSLLASLPVLILYLSLQRFLVGGLTSGAVKG
ncbi:ABC transporter permease subunit [Acidothermaceae bacterium B102]|nr:ABC transporter permease subunit [Acidothermaceae bacterium B102]